jgi:hypothetical protein
MRTFCAIHPKEIFLLGETIFRTMKFTSIQCCSDLEIDALIGFNGEEAFLLVPCAEQSTPKDVWAWDDLIFYPDKLIVNSVIAWGKYYKVFSGRLESCEEDLIAAS